MSTRLCEGRRPGDRNMTAFPNYALRGHFDMLLYLLGSKLSRVKHGPLWLGKGCRHESDHTERLINMSARVWE